MRQRIQPRVILCRTKAQIDDFAAGFLEEVGLLYGKRVQQGVERSCPQSSVKQRSDVPFEVGFCSGAGLSRPEHFAVEIPQSQERRTECCVQTTTRLQPLFLRGEIDGSVCASETP